MTRKPAEMIKPGDIILPPDREIRLWMRREISNRGLTDGALHLTVTETYEGNPDKRGRWIIIKANYPTEWNARFGMTIKARPNTPWPVIG